MKEALKNHTHVAVAYVEPHNRFIPTIVSFPVGDLNKYEFRVGPYLGKGETLNIGEHKVHLISVDSIKGKRYGQTAIVRKNVLKSIEQNAHTYTDVKAATDYLTTATKQ